MTGSAQRKPAQTEGKSDHQRVVELMKEMGSKDGYNPIPPPQHQWQMGKGEAPLHRMWAWMCAHTIAWGHRSPYAVSRDGKELHVEHIAADLEMDEANAYATWRKGVVKGLWRSGAKAEGSRRLFLCGEVRPEPETEPEEPDDPNGLNCLYKQLDAHIVLQIKDWSPERLKTVLTRLDAEDELDKAVTAAVMAAKRSIIRQRKDNVWTQEGVKPNPPQEHIKKTETPEEAEARRKRFLPLIPALELFVQTVSNSVQTSELSQYAPTNGSVQPTSADSYLIDKSVSEKARDRASSSILNASHGRENGPDLDGEKSVNEQYTPKQAESAKKTAPASPKPTQAQKSKPSAAQNEEALKLAKALELDLHAAQQIIHAVRAVDPKILLREIVGLGIAKLNDWKHQIRAGKVDNVPGRLIASIPTAALGGLRDTVRERAQRSVEKDLEYARLVVDDEEASPEDRKREELKIPELEAELEVLTAPHGGRAKGAGR